MDLDNRHNLLLAGFITLSLLLHLLLVYLLPELQLFPPQPDQKPVYVEMRPAQPEQRERELDLPLHPETDRPRETGLPGESPAKRLGPEDQTVLKETAPKGDAEEDQRPDAPVPPAPKARTQRTAPQTPLPVRQAPPGEGPQSGAARSQTALETPPTPVPLLDSKSLLQLPEATMARLEKDWRQKYRADVEEGNAVWLDTEKDVLISFFQRFRNNIYNVWNYPGPAAERREEGTCLLKITITRSGEVQQVRILESTGYRVLDDEAVAAVRRGAPYGSLPRAYSGEILNIFAFFNYNLSRRVIY
jgi:protein TonB